MLSITDEKKITSEFLKKVGNIIKRNRERKNISQEELAEYIHVNRTTISRFETGESEKQMLKKEVIIMVTFTIKSNQKPSEETLKRMLELRDEDIIYDDDCPEMTTKMQKAFECAVAQRNRFRKANMKKVK